MVVSLGAVWLLCTQLPPSHIRLLIATDCSTQAAVE